MYRNSFLGLVKNNWIMLAGQTKEEEKGKESRECWQKPSKEGYKARLQEFESYVLL